MTSESNYRKKIVLSCCECWCDGNVLCSLVMTGAKRSVLRQLKARGEGISQVKLLMCLCWIRGPTADLHTQL